MRYFLITFQGSIVSAKVEGNTWFESKDFPSRSLIISKACEREYRLKHLVVLNIFEFKNEEDYNNFNK